MRLLKLHKVILLETEDRTAQSDLDVEKNVDVYAELTLNIDDRSLSLIIRDAKNDRRKAVQILRTHYLPSSMARVIGLFTELTSLKNGEDEALTDYVLLGETAAAQLKNVGETVSDNLLIAMMLKGLLADCKSFIITVTMQRREPHTLMFFKTALHTHEDIENV